MRFRCWCFLWDAFWMGFFFATLQNSLSLWKWHLIVHFETWHTKESNTPSSLGTFPPFVTFLFFFGRKMHSWIWIQADFRQSVSDTLNFLSYLYLCLMVFLIACIFYIHFRICEGLQPPISYDGYCALQDKDIIRFRETNNLQTCPPLSCSSNHVNFNEY